MIPDRDRSGALRVFGGIQIAVGVLCAGILFLLLAGRFVSRSQAGQPALIYVYLSAALITLGIGSVRGKRWAWALTLVGSATTVGGGLLVAPFLVWMVSRFLAAEPALSGGGHSFGCAVLAPLVFMLCVLILIPLAFVLFYARRDVRATVERLDPEPGWTDRRPLPVLAAAVFFASTAVTWLFPVFIKPVIPIPGAILTGSAARAVGLLFALGGVAIGWALYRGLRGAWLTGVLFSVAVAGFSLWTLRDLDFLALQRAMGASEEELAVIRRIDIRPGLTAMTAAVAAAWTGFLLWVRKFLARGDPSVNK